MTARFLKPAVLVVTTMAILYGCTRKRDDYFPQGLGENLVAMKGFKVDYTLTTDKTKKADVGQSEASNLIVGKNSLNMKKFNVVGYKTDAELIPKDYEFIGNLGATYDIKYTFNDKYILVQKLVDEDTAPDFELRSFKKPLKNPFEPTKKVLEKAKQPKLEPAYVTMIGCPVTYYRVENQLNRNLEKTKALTEIMVRYPSDATHFRVKKENCKRFTNAPITDVLPKEYFKGEWYFSETLVDANRDMKAFQGFELNQKSRYRQASRVEFQSTQYSLRAIDTNIPEDEKRKKEKAEKEGRDENGVEEAPVVTIPLKNRYTFRVDENEALVEATDERIHWKTRDYVQMDFRRASGNFQIKDEHAEAMDFEIGQDENGRDYFSIVVNDRKQGARIRYAFRRIVDTDKTYEPRTFFQDDNNQFGFFTTAKMFANSREEILSQEDIDKNFLIARHNIKKGKIEYRFTHNSPEKYRPVALKALRAWESAFKMAGMDVKFEVKSGAPDVNLGDLRYNIINLIDEDGGRFLLGYGPSIIDSQSGEIVSATANIRVSAIREIEALAVSDYVREKVGFFEENYPCLVRNINLPDEKKFPKEYGIPVQSPRNKNCNTYRTLNYSKFKMIEKQCPKLKTYAESRAGKENRKKFIAGTDKLFSDEGKTLLTQCIDVVMEDQLMGTLVHELGHNLGLRHNFMASSDKDNFWNDEWVKANMPDTLDMNLGASIMDYESPNSQALRLPGKYDVAALLFGYAGKIMKASAFKGSVIEKDQLITLNPNRSIEGNLKDAKIQSKDIRQFKYCTDEDAVAELDPMCSQHDYGTTPLESTLHRMAQLEVDMSLYSFRYDKPTSPLRDQGFWILYKKHRFQPLRRMYEEWRWQMESRVRIPWEMYKKLDNPEIKIRDYLNQVKVIRKNLGDNNDGYYVSSNAIFEFLLNMVMLPNKYCVGIKNKQIKLLELNLARNEAFVDARRKGDRSVVTSCTDESLKKFFDNEFDQLSGETGFEIENVAYAENQLDRERRPLFDVEGFRNFREGALEYLIRWKDADATVIADVRGMRRLFSRFIDEPHFRHRLFQAFLDRNYYGVIVAPMGQMAGLDEAKAVVDINKLTFLSSLPEDMTNRYVTSVPKFLMEQQIVSYLGNTFKERLKYSQGPTGFERDDGDGARMFGVEITDNTTSACFMGKKTPRAELTIQELARKAPAQPAVATPGQVAPQVAPAVAAPAQPITPIAAEAPSIIQRYLCPEDPQFSYMSKMVIDRYNLAKDRYIGFSKHPPRPDDLDGNLMGHELQMGLEMMKRYMEPPIAQ